ncbi:hypothetical protein OH76DRAFT_1485815 [Lentinus brumalis]|uniref:F-box domain-containing protein n=1 Tax=Lentinus brumalis TaxID=2498619 RepID=A0A371D0F7_9APHY|nr:hypothetical protein OH76DRAFT_1485815 [Polyporus brumalis]
MEGCPLPIELCHLVIDYTLEPDPWIWECNRWERKDTPYNVISWQTSICFAWLPYARFVLYRSVVFKTPSQVDLFCRTITENPSLAILVRELIIKPKDKSTYIPFVRDSILKHLRRLDTLVYDLFHRKGTWVNPLRHHLRVAKFPITELVMNYPTRWTETFQLIWSIPTLETLRLRVGPSPEITVPDIHRLHAIQRRGACARLKTLVLTHEDGCSFLPRRAFGTSVEQLYLEFHRRSSEIPVSTIGGQLSAHFSSFASLKGLHIQIISTDGFGSGLTEGINAAVSDYMVPVLARLSPQTQDSLHTITYRCWCVWHDQRRQYPLELSSKKVDELLTKFPNLLSKFPNLGSLCFWLPGKSAYDAERWKRLLRSHLPRLEGIVPISVKIRWDEPGTENGWADDSDSGSDSASEWSPNLDFDDNRRDI